MNIKIARTQLLTGLAAVGSIIKNRVSLPVVAHVRLEATDTGLNLRGCDPQMDVGVSVTLPVEGAKSGGMTVPFKPFYALVKSLPGGRVHLERESDRLRVRAPGLDFRMLGQILDEYPDLGAPEYASLLRVSAKKFRALLADASFAASTEESRPILNGVYLHSENGDLRMTATNGHRMAMLAAPWEAVTIGAKNGKVPGVIVPSAASEALLKVLDDAGEIEVAFAKSENPNRSGWIRFRAGDREVVARAVEGPYPNYQQVIPKEDARRCRVVVDRTEMVRACRRVLTVASQQTYRTRIDVSEDRIALSVDTPDLAQGAVTLDAKVEGEPMAIGFNAKYLRELLDHVPAGDDRVELSLWAPERAALLRPVKPNGVEATFLLMPLRLLD